MEVPQKIKTSTNISSNSTSGYISKGNENRLSKTYLYSHVHCSIIHSICTAAAAAKSLQSCLTLCDPIDGSPPGSPVPGILQARTLEWVAISLSNAWKWKVKVKSLSRVQLLATPWTAAYQAPPSMGFSRQEYWSGVPLPSPIVHVYTHRDTKEYYSVMRKKQILPFVTTWMNLEHIMLSEISQAEKDKNCMVLLICC